MKVKDCGKTDLLKLGTGTGYRTKQSIDKANKQLAHFVELLEVRLPGISARSLRAPQMSI
jgi:hypothetical protein